MLELLFLLLPIAAAYGWYMGRRSAQQNQQQHADRLSRDYVAGVNFLLSDQQDKAVDLFLDMLKEDSSAFEAHLTLGNLFRSRGEVERAIRIHQSLMESASLSYDQRLLATQQLGRDYVAAGVYDRAEVLFLQLIDEADFRQSALQSLLSIYQSTSDWSKAIDIGEKLLKQGDSGQRENIANFYCELALQALGSDNTDGAFAYLAKAAGVDKNCAWCRLCRGAFILNGRNTAKPLPCSSGCLSRIKKWSVKHCQCWKPATRTLISRQNGQNTCCTVRMKILALLPNSILRILLNSRKGRKWRSPMLTASCSAIRPCVCSAV